MGTDRSGWLSTSLVWLACIGMAAAAIGLVLNVVKQSCASSNGDACHYQIIDPESCVKEEI